MKQATFTSTLLKGVRHTFVLALSLFLFVKNASAQTETLSTGSYIINMGVVPQTEANALKPYGLVYDLLKNYNVRIKWVISQTKLKDGTDFTYNGVDYKGGTFIIPAEYRTAAVNARITFFGVTGATTTSPLTVDVTHTLKYAPIWTLDTQNGQIAADFFTKAGIPATAYDDKTPAQLNSCDDIYVMPHADADWSYYGPLLNWVKNNRGSFWGGCRTGSQIENLFNPAIPSEQMNFLSNNVGAAGNALVPHNNHNDGTPPYNNQYPTSTAAQYMGTTEDAHQNGSEQIYLPKLNGGWRATTQVIAYDPTHSQVPSLSPGPAAAIVFGRAFGNNNYGWVMYEGGHDIAKATGPDYVAAQRAFWNFSFLSSVEKAPVISALNLSDILISGKPYVASVTASSPIGATLNYQWSSSCGGTFSAPTSATTNFTPPVVSVPTSCSITVVVTDACGRSVSSTKLIQVLPPALYPDINVTYVNEPVPGNVSTNDVVPAGTIYNTSAPALVSKPAGSTYSFISFNADGTYNFTADMVGVYVFQVPVKLPGGVAPYPTTLLTITVLCRTCINPPVANTDIATTKINTPVTLKTLSNDKAGYPGASLNPASVTVTVAALHGTSSINPATGDNTYTPNTGYTGMDTLRYSVCDNTSPTPLCATALQIIRIWPTGVENTTLAADDYSYTTVNVPVSGNAMTNDTDPEGNAQTITAQPGTTIAGKGTLVLASNGNYTFTPVAGFTGPVNFPYTTCDNGSPVACANATIYILVSPPLPAMYPDINVTYVNEAVPGDVSTNDVVPAGTVYNSSAPSLVSKPAGSTYSFISFNANGTYNFTADMVGVYVFKVPVQIVGSSAPYPSTLLTITVLCRTCPNNAPVANTDIATTKMNTPVILKTLSNDKAGSANFSLVPGSVTVTVAALHGTSSINPATGDNTYTPNAGYTGMDTLTYSVCDNQGVPKCATALQIINIRPTSYPNTTLAADDYSFTSMNIPVSGNAMTNDTDPEGNMQTITAQTTTIAGKGTLVLASNGNYTFTPVSGFTGPVNFPYTTCDDGTPQACANATIYILVSPLLPRDLAPNITALPNIMHGTTDFFVTVKTGELLGNPTDGSEILIRIPKDPKVSFTWEPTATMIGFTPVSNSSWTYDGSNPFFHVFKTNIVIAGGGFSTFGFLATFTPGQTQGKFTLSAALNSGSGGENNVSNNQDAESLDYFIN